MTFPAGREIARTNLYCRYLGNVGYLSYGSLPDLN